MICPKCTSGQYKSSGKPDSGVYVCPDCGHEEAQFSKTVYVCSPLRGNGKLSMEQHLQLAKNLSRWVKVEQRRIPITPHLYFTTFLDDTIPEERALGMAAGQALLQRVDEVYIFPVDGYFSQGMRAEIACLEKMGKTYRVLDIRRKFCHNKQEEARTHGVFVWKK